MQRVLCPVDLSKNSLDAIELATLIALQGKATLVFFYVAPQWLPEEAMFGNDYGRPTDEENIKTFEEIRPSLSDVSFEHIVVHGNPGPEIVKAAMKCDMVVMSTHGHGGMMRFLMGSVAQYTIRHALCPVVTFRNSKTIRPNSDGSPHQNWFVTDIMHHVDPIRGFDNMESIIAELNRANESGAPVVDDSRCCIGILTKSDIAKYRELRERYENRDPTVIDEVFETDEFGQRRATNLDFDLVRRHMTSPVITISNAESCQKACELFTNNSSIHHLIVVDDANHPIGVITTEDLSKCNIVSPSSK